MASEKDKEEYEKSMNEGFATFKNKNLSSAEYDFKNALMVKPNDATATLWRDKIVIFQKLNDQIEDDNTIPYVGGPNAILSAYNIVWPYLIEKKNLELLETIGNQIVSVEGAKKKTLRKALKDQTDPETIIKIFQENS